MALRSVAVLLIEPVAVFEFGVAVEVFGLDRSAQGIPLLDFRVCAEAPSRPLATSATAATRIVADHDLAGLEGADLVVIPATGSRAFAPEVLEAVRRAYAAGATLLTVCSGAFVLAETGLLDGRAATSHWFHHDELASRYPQVRWEVNRLFVDEDRIITSAGTAAGSMPACIWYAGSWAPTSRRGLPGAWSCRPSGTVGSNSSWRCPCPSTMPMPWHRCWTGWSRTSPRSTRWSRWLLGP